MSACRDALGRRRAVGALRHDHEYQDSRRRVRIRRSERRVQRAGGLEERLASGDDPIGPVIDAEPDLAFEHIPQHRPGMPMVTTLSGGGTQFQQDGVEAVERTAESMPRELAWPR